MANYGQLYTNAKQEAGRLYDKAEGVNIGKLFKFGLVVTVIILLFTLGKSLISAVKNFFGIDEKKQEESTLINPYVPEPVGQGYEPDILTMAGGTNHSNKTGAYEKVKAIQNLVDGIYDALTGINFQFLSWGSKGDIVNRLARLSKTDLQKAVYHWDITYKPITGAGIYNFIWWEFDSTSEYGAAMAALEKYKWTW